MTSQAPSSVVGTRFAVYGQVRTTGSAEDGYLGLLADVDSKMALAWFPVLVHSDTSLRPKDTISGVDGTRIPYKISQKVITTANTRGIAASETELVSIRAPAPDEGPLHDGKWHDVDLVFEFVVPDCEEEIQSDATSTGERR